MQTIPESGEMSQSTENPSLAPRLTPSALQHLEPLGQEGQRKQASSTPSVDSLLSLSDVDFGMEEEAKVLVEPDGAEPRREVGSAERSKVVCVRCCLLMFFLCERILSFF